VKNDGSLFARYFLPVFGSIFLIVGLLLLGAGINEALNEHELKQHGVVVQGMVLSKNVSHSSKNDTPSYSAIYRFSTPEGKVMQGNCAMDLEAWEKLKERRPVAVRYLPDKLTRNCVNGESGQQSLGEVLVFCIVGGIFTFVGGLILILGWRWRKQGKA
jgi:hypothetical protein